MPQFNATLVPAFLVGIPLHYLLAPVMLIGIFLVHFSYYRRALATNGQQVIEIDDLTNIDVRSAVPGCSVVEADNVEFCAMEGKTSICELPLSAATAVWLLGPKTNQRFSESVTIEDRSVFQTIICGEDLITDGTTTFHAAVKVGGDLIVRGTVTFEQPVVVNGVLKVEGNAHFSRGLIAKGDALVTGHITIGSRDKRSWAVVRQLTLETRLRLNGQLISDQELVLPKAA